MSELKNFYNRYVLGVGDNFADSVTRKIPFFIICFSPWGLLLNKFWVFTKAALWGSLVLSACSLALGYAYICGYGVFQPINFYCTSNYWIYIPNLLIKFLILGAFALGWRNLLVSQPLSWMKIVTSWRQILNVMGLFAVFLVAAGIPLISFLVLYFRVPNPDWRIEISFFAMVSIGFLVPFIAMRFLSLFAFVLNGEKIPPLWQIWLRSGGNLLKILFSLTLMIFVGLFIFNNFFLNFKSALDGNLLYVGIATELLYNYLLLIFFALFLNHCFIQKQYLFSPEAKK